MLGRSRAFAATLLFVALSATPIPAAAATGPLSVDARLTVNAGLSDLNAGDALQIAFSETMDATTAAATIVVADADGSEAALTCGVDGTTCAWNVSTTVVGGITYAPGRVLSVTVGAIAGPPGTTPGLQLPAEIIGAGGIAALGVRWDLAGSPDLTVDVETDVPSFTWTALQRSAHVFFADESTDSIADVPRGFTREWSGAVFKEPRGDPEWPARIQVTTNVDPATLTTYPEATPAITPAGAVYQWSSVTNSGPQPILTSRVLEVLPTGLSLERNVYGGRDIAPGMTIRRTFTVVGRTSQPFRSIQLSITLGPLAGQPVTPSAVTCAQAPSIVGSQYDWHFFDAVPGTDLLVQCDVTLTNTSTSLARWAPHIFVNAHLISDTPVPTGATAIVGTNDLGETRFTVEPPAGSNVQGTLRSIAQRLVSLRGENRTTAPPATQWTAQSTYTEFISLPDDIALDSVRPMQRSWGRSVHKFDGSPPWPVSITLDTAADITVFPAVTPVAIAGGSRYSWSLETGAFANAFGRAPHDATVGFDLSRALVGGREIAPGATERRRFTFDMTATTDVPGLNVFVYFAQPGSTPAPPVTASDVSCTPAPTFNFDPLRPQWATGASPRGTGLHVACDVTLRNTTSARAMYMPGVSASQGRSFSVALAPGEPRAVHVDPVLGTTEFVVSPPTGVAHAGRLVSFESHQIYLRDENRGANTVGWYATISTDLHSFERGDSISTTPRDFSRSFSLYSGVDTGATWPSTIVVTTQLPTADLTPFPTVAPTTGPDGATYRWSGNTPFGSFATLSQLTPVVATPTVAVSRRLDGGREVPAGATVVRQLTVSLDVAADPRFLQATVFFRSYVPPGGAAPPVTASEVSCPGATFYPFDLTTARWFALAGGVGQTHALTCTVRLTNTSDRPARYMPEVSVYAHVTSVHSAGTDRFAVDDPVLGRASVTVTPPADVVATGRFLHLESRHLTLGPENVAVSAVPWTFSVTNGLTARTAEDSYADDDRAFSRGWFFSLQKPAGWGASIAATTALDTTGWASLPQVTPTAGAAGATYRWETSDPSLFANLSTLGARTVTTSLGASVTRELVGLRAVPPGTATRELVIRLVRRTADPVRVSVYFHGAFDAPGGTVTASAVSCAGATPQSPTGAFWLRLTPPIGVPLELRCTAVLTNATPYDASYMPLIIVARDAPPVVSGPLAGTSHDVEVDVLGTVRAEVTPPSGVVAEATVTTFASRELAFAYRNARVIPTRLELTGDTRRYLDETVTLAARLTDAVTGAAVAGRSVELRAGPITRVVTTDAAGVASVRLAAGTLANGTHPVTAAFAGQGEHQAASAAGSLEILRIPTRLTYTGDTSATFGFAALSARLTDERTGAPVASATLTFAVDGVGIGDVPTDATGMAVLVRIPLPRLLPGAHAVGVSFAGDAVRGAAATTAQLSIVGSSGKVAGAVVTANGLRAELNVSSDGRFTSGQLKVADGTTLDLHLKDVRAIGISGNVAVIYAPTGDGRHLVAVVTDGGEPGTADRLILRLDGAPITGDGAVSGGNLQIHRD